jgi:hypothetical protein
VAAWYTSCCRGAEGAIDCSRDKEAIMLRMSAQTHKGRDDVIGKAISFFGLGGIGLRVTLKATDHVRFEGGGGYVTINAAPRGSEVEVTAVTQEWEMDVRRFLGQV